MKFLSSVAPPIASEISLNSSQGGEKQNPAEMYLNSLGSKVSRSTMVSPLNRMAGSLNPAFVGRRDAWRSVPWEKIKVEDVRLFMANLKGSPATRNKALAALKGVARAAWELEIMKDGDFTRISSIRGDAGTREIAGRYIPAGETSALLKVCAHDRSSAGARDGAIISMAAATGMRRAELASVLCENVQKQEDGSFIIRIIGKRNKERLAFVQGGAAHALSDWLAVSCLQPGCKLRFLFCAIRKGGVIVEGTSLSTTALDKMLRKRSEMAGVVDLDWHDIRRTVTSDLLDAGADLSTVAGLLGHQNVQTTMRYDRRGERARRQASQLISVPYFRRAE